MRRERIERAALIAIVVLLPEAEGRLPESAKDDAARP
jgi:hypothetical protein